MNNKLNVILFFTIIFGLSLTLLFLPKQKHSNDEKRDLAVFPKFTTESYLEGEWTKKIDGFIDDHFPFRNEFIFLTPYFHASKGFELKNTEKVFVVKSKKKENLNRDAESEKKDTLAFFQDFEENFSGSMLIINGCVYPMGAGNPNMAKSYGNMVSEYAKNFPELRVFSVVAPLSSAFIPVLKYKKYNTLNKKTLLAIKNNLNNGVIFSDVFEELNNHSSKKLYFGTDHHWKPIGAYYAYVAFCKSANFTPVPLEKMTKKVKYDFVGTMYQYTKDPSVKAHPDTMEYWEPNVKTEAINLGAYSTTKGSEAKVFYESSSGGNTYSTFLGGDRPLMKIQTSVKNGKKAVVIKNSMGNAFAVYLISHYQEIWVVDLRYSKQNLTKIIKENKINDLIFAIGMYAATSKGTIEMMKRLATQKGTEVTPQKNTEEKPEVPVKVDTIKQE